MKRVLLVAVAVAATALALMAAGESGGGLRLDGAGSDPFQLNVIGPRGGVVGGVIKNAPFSGEEVTAQDNVLGDGTHIHNESRTRVYRDAEGRTRRESEDRINIYDPVAGIVYVLNPKTMTARQMKVSVVTTITKDGVTTTTTASGGGFPANEVHTGSGVGGGVGVGVDGPNYVYQTNHVETASVTDNTAMTDAAAAKKLRAEKMATAQATAQAMDQMKADTEARVAVIKKIGRAHV